MTMIDLAQELLEDLHAYKRGEISAAQLKLT